MTGIKQGIIYLCFILATCQIDGLYAKQQVKHKAQPTSQASWFKTDIEGIDETMLYPEFWKQKGCKSKLNTVEQATNTDTKFSSNASQSLC
ncbi:MAG: hypothetical protein Q9M92_11010 [Enterobacterales bacterium]|nr:hypothetical protein [Enterobacterales bacterium]